MKILLYKTSTALLFILFVIIANGQSNPPAVYEIIADTASVIPLPDSCYKMLEDKNGKWSINDVTSSALIKEFHDRSKKINGVDTLVNTYWFYYRLENKMPVDVKISLNSMSEYDDFYVLQNGGKWKHYTSGFLNTWEKRDGLKWANLIPLVLKPGQLITLYQRIYNNHKGLPPYFSISIYNTEKAVQENYVEILDSGTIIFSVWNLQEAFMIGILLLSIFFNLFFYSVVKEKVYLYFALFAFFLAINRLYNISYGYFLLNNHSLLKYVPYLKYAWAFISFFLIQFVRGFFHIKEKYKNWDKYLLFIAILNLVQSFIELFSELFAKKYFNVLINWGSVLPFFIIPISILVTLLLFIHTKNRAFRFLIIGAFPYNLWYSVTFPAELRFKFFETSSFFKELGLIFRPVEVACIIWLILFFSWTLFMRYNQLRKENSQKALDNEKLLKEKETERRELIEKQNTELEQKVTLRTSELKQSLEELKSTQAQLIQTEKMASLGELTAGIAHEIQNPLNFVNNFSEVNTELIDELQAEINSGNTEEALSISHDIKENSEKINHHGKRAGDIVKGMLQHSRISTGVKEPTDINALTDEYLRLSYQGLRAKDKGFNAAMKTDFDESIGKINIIPQDIGRVLLNLYNNAFYACTERSRASTGSAGQASSAGQTYEPTVSVTTKKSENHVIITVSDNGNGIPQKIVDKIFQPFFTTKPTGQGTGLGLSLSYDIVKAHGGEIKVESQSDEAPKQLGMEEQGTTFLIVLRC